MRVVFISHNELGLACLEELIDLGADVKAIFTRPQTDEIADQVGFGDCATSHGITMHEVDSVNTETTAKRIAGYNPDLLFVIGWSRLVDSSILQLASLAALGMHPAPLPRGRGRAPIAWSLIKGLNQTALSFFHLVEEADAGPLVDQKPINISREDTAASLYQKIIAGGRSLINTNYPLFEQGTVPENPQDETQATWWPKRNPHHGLIDWNQSPTEIYNWIRGQSHPYPGAFSYLDDDKITIWEAQYPDQEVTHCQPGELLSCNAGGLRVGAWEGTIELTEVQVGEETIPAAELVRSRRYQIGDRFESARDAICNEQ